MPRIYLDHNATTPLDPRVFETMRPWLEGGGFGNASSLHSFGQAARAAVDGARAQVAALVGATAAEIVFTSGGTEADNLALRGAAAAAGQRRKIVVSAVEHHAVLNTAKALRAEGLTVEIAPVDAAGRVDLPALRGLLDEHTALLALMLANNETGVLHPVAEAAAMAKAKGAVVHCDAVQAAGRVALRVEALGCDLLALSAHKVYGPQGVGALYVRRGTAMQALLRGGSQERNRRAGTENVAGAVGFGRAAELAAAALDEGEPARVAGLRDRLEQRLLALPGAMVNGAGLRVANTTNVSFDGADAEALLVALDLMGVAVSTGAACAAGAAEPSHVLVAMGLPEARVAGSLRFSLGRGTTDLEVDRAAALVIDSVQRLRG